MKFTGIVVAATLLLTGCISLPGNNPGGGAVDSRLYLGPIPAPSPLPSISALPQMPTPPVDYNDKAALDKYLADVKKYSSQLEMGGDAQTRMMDFSEAVNALAETAKLGGEKSVAAWQSLLVTAGISVAGVDGKPIQFNGGYGSGWPVTDPELRMLALMGTSSDGLRLVDLADALKAIPEIADVDVATALLDNLRTLGSYDFAFSTVFHALSPDSLYRNYKLVPLEEVSLTFAQVSLVLRKLSVELLTTSGAVTLEPDAAAIGVHMQPASFVANSNPQAAKQPCNIDTGKPWADEMLTHTFKTLAFGFDFFINYVVPEAARFSVEVSMSLARAFLAFATVMIKIFQIRAEFSLSDSPLVRTKDTVPGELRDLDITFSYDKKGWTQVSNCINLFFAFTGFELPTFKDGPVDNVSVDLRSDNPSILRIGDGKRGAKSVTVGKTNSDGEVRFILSGAPQADFIPEKAEPDMKTVRVWAESNLESNQFFKDMNSLPWAGLDALGSAGLSVIPIMLSRMKIKSHATDVPVRDWKLTADFVVTAEGSMTIRSAANWNSGGGCGPATDHSYSVDGKSSFTSEPVDVSAHLLSIPGANLGTQAVVYAPKGQGLNPVFDENGFQMFSLRGKYTTEKSYSNPGKNPLPPKLVHEPSKNCGDGDVNASKPTPDCGPRSYTGDLKVSIPVALTIHVTGDRVEERLWKHCGPAFFPVDPPVAPGIESCKDPKSTGGTFPSVADVFDPEKTRIEVSGTLHCGKTEPGSLESIDYSWTLVFCRVAEGEPTWDSLGCV